MIRLLLCLSVLWLSADATVVENSPSRTFDLTSCPITYFGQEYDTLYVDFNNAETLVCFDQLQTQDCIKLPGVVSQTFTADVGIDFTGSDGYIHSLFPYINGPSTCGVLLQFQLSTQVPSNIFLINYGTQAVVLWLANLDPGSSATFELLVAGDTVATTSEPFYYHDLIGCRQDGSVRLKDGEIPVPDTCTTKTCLTTGEWGPETSKCTSTQSCLGNNICGTEQFCSVIGPTYINFHQTAGVIPDFCSYTLLSVTGLTVTGYFNDRRLTDVPFLSKVVLTTTADISLSEGGTVSTDATELPLSTPETHHGVDLSKDDSGVTAEFKGSNGITTTVFYDGTILHITHTVLEGETPTGACAAATPDGTYKDNAKSPADCATVTSDPKGDGIDCPAITSECNQLEIDSCEVDPEPYREACENLFCKYPEVDGLKCDILHAYAKTCKHQDWTDTLSCPAPVCPNHKCGDNEFCAVNLGGEPACFCRGRFSSKYESSGSYGEPTVCEDKSASITLYTCFLEELSIDYSGWSLRDASCKGEEDLEAKTLTFSFSDTKPCGAILTAEKDQIVIKNHITNTPTSIITREDQITLIFSCTYTEPDVKSLTLKIKENSIVQVFDSVDIPFTLLMSAFTDAGLTQAVTSDLALDQNVWVTLEAQGVDTVKLALVIDNCWATSDPSPTATNKYDLIIDECANPSDDTVEVVSNGETEVTTFSYNVFQFIGSDGDVYLHCQVHLCIKDDGCVPDCTHNARRRRSLAGYKSENPALITMAWTN